MKYRGFEVSMSCKDDKVNCYIYTAEDKDHFHPIDEILLVIGKDISDTSEETVLPKIIGYIDKNISDLMIVREKARRNIIIDKLGQAVCYIGEQESGEELLDTLQEQLGMTEDEIREIGFTSLVPYFDKESYAQCIADYMTETGTTKSTSGNWHFSFSEINSRFAVCIPEDKELLDMIVDNFDPDIVSDICVEEDFDLMFYLQYCPYAESGDLDMDMTNLF